MTAVPAPVPAPAARAGRLAGRPAHWFPLALFGVLVALSALLYAVPLPRRWATNGTGLTSRSFSWSSSLHSSGYGSSFVIVSSGGQGVAAEAWYWAAAPAIGFLLTALWYRRAARRGGSRAPRALYLIAGLLLTAAATAAPLLAAAHAPFPAWAWLSGQWGGGLFALLAVAAGLGLLAGQVRSRALGIAVAAFTLAVLLVNWPAIRGAWPALTYRGGDPWHAVLASAGQPLPGAAAPVLPALVLLAASVVLLIRPARPGQPMDAPTEQ